MQYIKQSTKNFDTTCKNLEASIEKSNFGVLHIHDMKATMAKKDVELGQSCKVYEICNPHLAKEVLTIDMSANMLLPCRISVYTENNETVIGMVNPTELMKVSTQASVLHEPALLVENKLQELINNSL
jgi:uncharacterized protein (DUF302 family)